MCAAWLNRGGLPYPDYFREPRLTAPSLTALAERVTSRE